MKIIKLTESDLTKLVKRVLKEQGYFDDVKLMPTAYQYNQERERENASPKATPKENINPKNLKIGAGGRSNPSQVADVNRLQTKLIALGLLKTKSGQPTGYFGDATKKALDTYNQSSGPQTESFPIKNREEGNAFRAWANDNYPRLSKTLELDRSGSFNNEYIKRAWNANVQGKTLGQLYLTAKLKGQVSGATAGAEAGKTSSKTQTSKSEAEKKIAKTETGTDQVLDPNASLLFDGDELHWIVNGVKVKAWDAISGLTWKNTPPSEWNKMLNRYTQNRQEWSKQKDAGPLPEGKYSAGPLETRTGEPVGGLRAAWLVSTGQVEKDTTQNKSFSSDTNISKISWGNYRMRITPTGGQEMYDRSAFYIHGGAIAGSHGCIDLTDEMDDFSKFFGIWTSSTGKKTIPLTVKYENSMINTVINKLVNLF
jgi:hypothetical protein